MTSLVFVEKICLFVGHTIYGVSCQSVLLLRVQYDLLSTFGISVSVGVLLGVVGPIQILSELLFQASISPKDMSNQTKIPYVTPNVLTPQNHEKYAFPVATQAYLPEFVRAAYLSARNRKVTRLNFVVFCQKIFLFTFVNKCTYVFVVHNALEVKKGTQKETNPPIVR